MNSMRISLKPKTTMGKWSTGLIIAFLLFFLFTLAFMMALKSGGTGVPACEPSDYDYAGLYKVNLCHLEGNMELDKYRLVLTKQVAAKFAISLV